MLALQLIAGSTRSQMRYSQVDATRNIARRRAATAAAVVPRHLCQNQPHRPGMQAKHLEAKHSQQSCTNERLSMWLEPSTLSLHAHVTPTLVPCGSPYTEVSVLGVRPAQQHPQHTRTKPKCRMAKKIILLIRRRRQTRCRPPCVRRAQSRAQSRSQSRPARLPSHGRSGHAHRASTHPDPRSAQGLQAPAAQQRSTTRSALPDRIVCFTAATRGFMAAPNRPVAQAACGRPWTGQTAHPEQQSTATTPSLPHLTP